MHQSVGVCNRGCSHLRQKRTLSSRCREGDARCFMIPSRVSSFHIIACNSRYHPPHITCPNEHEQIHTLTHKHTHTFTDTLSHTHIYTHSDSYTLTNTGSHPHSHTVICCHNNTLINRDKVSFTQINTAVHGFLFFSQVNF
jgi:hypothetical protein